MTIGFISPTTHHSELFSQSIFLVSGAARSCMCTHASAASHGAHWLPCPPAHTPAHADSWGHAALPMPNQGRGGLHCSPGPRTAPCAPMRASVLAPTRRCCATGSSPASSPAAGWLPRSPACGPSRPSPATPPCPARTWWRPPARCVPSSRRGWLRRACCGMQGAPLAYHCHPLRCTLPRVRSTSGGPSHVHALTPRPPAPPRSPPAV